MKTYKTKETRAVKSEKKEHRFKGRLSNFTSCVGNCCG